MNEEARPLIVTGSFNGLLDRLARVDYWDAWVAGKKITNTTKKAVVEATIPASVVFELTGFTTGDLDIFSSSLGFIKIVEDREDPLLSAQSVFGLLKVFERFVDQGIIKRSR